MGLLQRERGGAQPHLTQTTRRSWFKTWGLLRPKNLWVQLKLWVLFKPERKGHDPKAGGLGQKWLGLSMVAATHAT